MKKLLVVSAAAFMAIVASASNVNWKINLGSSDEAKSSYTFWDGKSYYAINGDASSYIQMLTDGDVAGFASAVDGLVSAGNAKSGTFGTYSFSAVSGTNSNAADLLTLIALSGTDPNDKFYYTTASTSGMTYEAGQQAPGTLTPAFASYNSGTIGDVPEPTSAMLLLLGVAGLALKRRRA